ncbi:hypothetical protein [Paenibacillus alvei]|uniref:hypothetical protein n=1 Tax=Paenibacillus alvei TaxID=44250 RepID=UPI0013DB18DA|nr:hypothetical protein [Paenibacillus alvei]NEZ45227.1 hypothetical protein [Paenibacillus alvei]
MNFAFKNYLIGIVAVLLSFFMISSAANASFAEKVLVTQGNIERGTYKNTKVAAALGTVANRVNSNS